MGKKRRTKKKELTPKEKLDKLIKEGKILSTPMFSGDTEAKEERTMTARNLPVGYVQVGTSQGLTFSEEPDSRVSTWHRLDMWFTVFADVRHIEEVTEVLNDYMVDKLADKYEDIMDSNE